MKVKELMDELSLCGPDEEVIVEVETNTFHEKKTDWRIILGFDEEDPDDLIMQLGEEGSANL